MDEPLAWQNHGGAAAAKRPLLAIKLGGAAITKKSERGTIDSKNLATCAAAIATCFKSASCEGCDLLVLHGAGSFGHHEAKQYGIGAPGPLTGERCMGAAITHAAVQQLSALLVGALLEADVPAVSISPMASWNTHAGPKTVVSDNWSGVQHCLAAGMLPVLHGDVALDSNPAHHTCILSGDELMVGAAATLPLSLSVFVSGVDGLYDKPPPPQQLVAAPSAPSVPPSLPGVLPAEQPTAARRIARAVATNCSAQGALSLGALAFADGELLHLEGGSGGGGFETATDAHDVTGGIAEKITCALQVAHASHWRSAGVPVLLTGVHGGSERLADTLHAAVKAAKAGDDELPQAIITMEQKAMGTLVLPWAIDQLLGD